MNLQVQVQVQVQVEVQFQPRSLTQRPISLIVTIGVTLVIFTLDKIHRMRAIIFFVTFLVCQFSVAQQSPYAQKWTEVDTLELRGQVASALRIVDQIRTDSKGDNGNDFVKASIYRWKFLKITTENAENTIIQEVDRTITEASGIEKALFYTIKGNLLKAYFESNRYRNNERSAGQNKTADITWLTNI